MRFVGCYIDKKKRDLPVMAGSGSMSIPKCYRLCRAKRYAYFGVQYSKECWCGNSYGKYGKRSKSECRMKCSVKSPPSADRAGETASTPLDCQLEDDQEYHSVGWNGKCSRAIDGNTNQNYGKKSCTHTRTATGAWWQARTSRRARITSVRIYNRRDCCANRLRNFVIKVDGRVCASYRSSRAFSVRTFRCNAVGRTVRIQTRNRVPLTLCEVQVFGRYAKGRSRSRTPGMRFVGCYIDKKKRDLPVMAGSGSMSIPKCYRLCRAKRYAYFGVQYSKECWCGNSYGKYGKRSKSECRMKCSGKKSTFCGSSWRNSIYTTGLPARRRPRVSRLPLSRCSQHSVGWNGKCSRAIDGNTKPKLWKEILHPHPHCDRRLVAGEDKQTCQNHIRQNLQQAGLLRQQTQELCDQGRRSSVRVLPLVESVLCEDVQVQRSWSHSPHPDEESSTADSVRSTSVRTLCRTHSKAVTR
uniref:WSC domain-containing protein n=1 Tax=Macrostomum lignano TaxID=282301 RepID=A0A1I8J2B5_9PLAT